MNDFLKSEDPAGKLEEAAEMMEINAFQDAATTQTKLQAAIALLWEFRFNAADRCVDCQCSADNDHHSDCRIAELCAGREGMGIADKAKP